MITTPDALDARTSRRLRDLLPGLGAAFDEPRMRQVLQTALLGDAAHGSVIERCEREHAVFVPDQRCVLRYTIEVREPGGGLIGPALVSVRLFPSAHAAREHLDSCLRPLAAAMRGRDEITSFATPAAVVEALCLTASLFPIDGDLPALVRATDPAAMLEVLRETLVGPNGRPFAPTRCRVEVAHYPRQHHCVLRYALENGDASHPLIVYGKLAGDDRGAVTMAAVPELRARLQRGRTRAFTVPRALGLVEPLRLVLLEAIAGAPRISQLLKQRLVAGAQARDTRALEESVDWAATVAAGLHSSGVKHGRKRELEQELDEMYAGLAVLERVSPELGDEFRAWLADVKACTSSSEPWPACFSHGDFSPSQIFFSGDECALIDFDTICQAEPMLDLGQFLSYLRLTARKAGGAKTAEGRELTERLCERFVDGYIRDRGFGPEHERRLRERILPYEMLSLLRLVLHSWRKFKRERLELVIGVIRERLPALARGSS